MIVLTISVGPRTVAIRQRRTVTVLALAVNGAVSQITVRVNDDGPPRTVVVLPSTIVTVLTGTLVLVIVQVTVGVGVTVTVTIPTTVLRLVVGPRTVTVGVLLLNVVALMNGPSRTPLRWSTFRTVHGPVNDHRRLRSLVTIVPDRVLGTIQVTMNVHRPEVVDALLRTVRHEFLQWTGCLLRLRPGPSRGQGQSHRLPFRTVFLTNALWRFYIGMTLARGLL